MHLYLVLLFALCLVLIGVVCVRPVRIYEFPYFMGATFLIFIVPQAVALNYQYWTIPQMALDRVLLMALLSAAACWAGYQFQPSTGFVQRLKINVNVDRFFYGGVALTVIGILFTSLLNALPAEAKGTQFTGVATIYHFFAQLIYPGFGICLYSAINRPRLSAIVATAVGAIIPLWTALFLARRMPAALFLITIGLTLYYNRRLVPPRWAIIGALVFATLFIPSTGNYRSMADEGPVAAITQLNLIEQFTEYIEQADTPELRNAAYHINAVTEEGVYRWGVDYWNRLVFRFVPAQIVGRSIKDFLTINADAASLTRVYGYDTPTGTTKTGLADAFMQFGYFGCLVFAAMAYLFKNLWVASLQPGTIVVQVFYIQCIVSALRALTHQTMDFLPGLVYSAAFLGLVVWYAREPSEDDSSPSYPNPTAEPVPAGYA